MSRKIETDSNVFFSHRLRTAGIPHQQEGCKISGQESTLPLQESRRSYSAGEAAVDELTERNSRVDWQGSTMLYPPYTGVL